MPAARRPGPVRKLRAGKSSRHLPTVAFEIIQGNFRMKRVSIAVLALVLMAGETAAAPRRDISNMTCEQINALLRADGKALLRSPAGRVKGLMKWDFYISDRAICPGLETRVKRRIRSTTGTCYVAQCVENGQSLRR